MYISIDKASGSSKCRYDDCKQKPEFIKNGRIVKGTICACVVIESAQGNVAAYYCRDCINKIWLHAKEKLNPNLWAFK